MTGGLSFTIMKQPLLTTLAVLVMLTACAPTDIRPDRVDEDPEQARIEQLLTAGDYRAAALALTELAGARPEQAPGLHIDAAEAWLKAGNADQAETALERVDMDRLGFFDQVRVDLARAELSLLRDDLPAAGWLLAHNADHLPGELIERHRALEDRLRRLETEPVRSALTALEEALAEPDFHPETALALLIEFPLDQLEVLVYEVGDRPDLLPWLDLVISAREHLLDEEALLQSLRGWQSRYPEVAYSAEQAHSWISAWRRSRPLPGPVSVLLPGPDSPLYRPGHALRDGILAGWLELIPRRRPDIRFHYLGEGADAVIPAWFDAREQGAEFVIGPLDRDQVDALLTLPDGGLIPTVLLNRPRNPEHLHQAEGSLASLALPPEEEAEMAAVRALVAGHERAVVLARFNNWGERVAQAFAETFELGGGQILQNRIYDPDRADHSFLLTEVLEIDQSESRIEQLARVLNEPVESVPQRRTDVDVIFLAARAEDGRQLRPQLRFFDAGDVPLMATSHIIAGAPRPERDRDLDGLLVPMAPWFLDFTPAGQIRNQALERHAYLDNPTLSRLYALGRDAMALLPWLEMMRADSRLQLPGMTGRLTLPDGRVIQRDLPFVRIRDGHARPE